MVHRVPSPITLLLQSSLLEFSSLVFQRPQWPLLLPGGELAFHQSPIVRGKSPPFHKPLLPFALNCLNANQGMVFPKTCQSPFPSCAIFSFCQDKVSWQWYPRNLRPISHQLDWEVTSQKHPDLCRPSGNQPARPERLPPAPDAPAHFLPATRELLPSCFPPNGVGLGRTGGGQSCPPR